MTELLLVSRCYEKLQDSLTTDEKQGQLIPIRRVFQIMGQRCHLSKEEARQLGNHWQKQGLLTIAKHGWKVQAK